MKQAEGQAVEHIVRPVVGVPLNVRGLESQEFIVDAEIEIADGTALVVRLEHLPAEPQTTRSTEDDHLPSFIGFASNCRESLQA